jgi:FtsZ-binding cell division protein ZapB
MDIEGFNKLEEKVRNLVGVLKHLKDENKKLKIEMSDYRKGASELDKERNEVKLKVKSLIELIESIE